MTSPTPQDPLVLYGQTFASRLLLGTSRYPSPAVLEAAVQRARPAMVTASLRRQGSNPAESGSSFWELLRKLDVPVLPNTAGCHSAQEAITTAQMAREVFGTPWIKLELIGDDYTLQPDTLNLVGVAEHLIKDGFQVLPYCTEDLVLCQRLVDVGCQAVMPWAAPIGTGRGPVNPYALQMLRERLDVPMLVDAGLRRRAAQHGRGLGARPGGHGGRVCRCRAWRSGSPTCRRHGRARCRPAQHARAGHAVLAPQPCIRATPWRWRRPSWPITPPHSPGLNPSRCRRR